MPDFYVLVLDENKNDQQYWLSSASSKDPNKLQALACYNDPPHGFPRALFWAMSAVALNKPIPPCTDAQGQAVSGTIYGLEHV